MHTALPVILLAALVALGGCVRRFEEPRPDEPHAVVKVRILHHVIGGPQLEEGVRLNGFGVSMPRAAPGVPSESLRVLRVRPELSEWRFATTYFHTVTRTELRTEYRTESYPCGTTTTGYGSSQHTSTRYCTRQVPQQRWVTVTDRVVDAACSSGMAHIPLVGGIYIVQHDFFGNHCTAQCFRQLPGPAPGTFQLIPCGAGEPPGVPTSGAEVLAPPVPSTYR